MKKGLGGNVLVVTATIGVGALVLMQRNEAIALRGELEGLRTQGKELAELRAENQRLKGRQIPAVTLENLRADHAALPKLRAEIETLKSKAREKVR